MNRCGERARRAAASQNAQNAAANRHLAAAANPASVLGVPLTGRPPATARPAAHSPP